VARLTHQIASLGAILGALLTSGCPSQPTVLLRFSGEPVDALVTVNDRYIGKLGRLSRRGIKLPPGQYRVTVEQTGYFSFDRLLQVDEDSAITVAVELTEVPD
jgi:hypothetical protein